MLLVIMNESLAEIVHSLWFVVSSLFALYMVLNSNLLSGRTSFLLQSDFLFISLSRQFPIIYFLFIYYKCVGLGLFIKVK